MYFTLVLQTLQELLDSVRSRLHAGAAAVLTAGSGTSMQRNGDGDASIVPGLPPQHHAAVSAVAAALAELQQLESDSAVDSSSAGAAFIITFSCLRAFVRKQYASKVLTLMTARRNHDIWLHEVSPQPACSRHNEQVPLHNCWSGLPPV